MSEKKQAPEYAELSPGRSRREMLLATTSVGAGALLDCGAPDELGSGACMGTQPSSSVVASGAEALAEGKDLRVIGTTKPIYVARDNRGFMAINATCTHQGCEAIYVDASKAYECGCHGSRFGFDGTVIMGPAQRPLSHVFICRNSDGLFVVHPDNVLSSSSGRIPP